jgi:hypothetical protein
MSRSSVRSLRQLVALAVLVGALAALPPVAVARSTTTGPRATTAKASIAAASGRAAVRKRTCAGLEGKKLRRCRAIAKCKKLKGKKRRKCLKKARRIGLKRPPAATPRQTSSPQTSPPQTTVQVLQTRPRPPTCAPFTDFDSGNFPSTPSIDNPLLPMAPGTQFTLEGRANRGGGPLPHEVVFTVTDLTKVINGVRTVVVWDVDTSEGELVETELAFFAQDNFGNVWNLGEYPEEWEGGNFAGAPKTWIAGQADAEAGVHMQASPTVTDPQAPWYVQGSAPAIDFLDCARVAEVNQSTCVPVNCYDNVLVTHETSPLDPESGIQAKFHAPGVGIVQVGALNDPEGETLVLANRSTLDGNDLDAAREEAKKLDERAYEVSEAYRSTPPAE